MTIKRINQRAMLRIHWQLYIFSFSDLTDVTHSVALHIIYNSHTDVNNIIPRVYLNLLVHRFTPHTMHRVRQETLLNRWSQVQLPILTTFKSSVGDSANPKTKQTTNHILGNEYTSWKEYEKQIINTLSVAF